MGVCVLVEKKRVKGDTRTIYVFGEVKRKKGNFTLVENVRQTTKWLSCFH